MNFKERGAIIALLLSIFTFQSCEMIEYHPYDGQIKGEKGINEKNIARIEQSCAGKTSIRFVMMSDTQRSHNETEDFVTALNKRTDVDFVINGGDISDFGLTQEFIWMRNIMNKLTVPYVVLLGNHDCLANGLEIYRQIFGTENFSFLAGETKFICLNTNALEFDYSIPVPDFKFLEDQYIDNRPTYKKTVFAMHVKPFSDQFNNNVANVFERYIKEFRNLQFCVNGHGHNTQVSDLFDDGVLYYEVANIAKRKFLLFTLKPDNTYDYEVVEF